MKRSAYVIIGLVAIILVLTVVKIAISNLYAADGITLATIQDEVASYQKQNMMLREQVYSLSSLTHIASSAASLGFVESSTPIAIDNVQPLALKQ